ncbi:hypothetical protein CYY_003347 [Polysphondylium violaceum]|uniref:FCP1 homology domain-containing protein n=1 Tax=Polysphondylium violaceum TaxID=133409 RepID=A0A8J4Q6Y8_9MYCE|nr:hypothetical protein CYY_003347 [Polysphondylium violaceum]
MFSSIISKNVVGKTASSFYGIRALNVSAGQKGLFLNSRFYSTQNNNNQKKENTNNKENKQDDKNKKKVEEEEDEDEDEEFKKRKSFIPSAVSNIGTGILLSVLIGSTVGYALYHYKQDLSEDEVHQLKDWEISIRDKVGRPWREFFDNMFNNLRDSSPVFESVFGTAPTPKVISPRVPGSKEYLLVIDAEAISELSTHAKHPALFRRAGLDYLLSNLYRDYEIYINYSNPSVKIESINYKLDPSQTYISGSFNFDSGVKERNIFTKNYDMFDRDPKKIIFLDTHNYDHPNVINIGKYNHKSKDATLIHLTPVLAEFSKKKMKDIPTEIASIKGTGKSLNKSLDEYLQTKKQAAAAAATPAKK